MPLGNVNTLWVQIGHKLKSQLDVLHAYHHECIPP